MDWLDQLKGIQESGVQVEFSFNPMSSLYLGLALGGAIIIGFIGAFWFTKRYFK